MITSCCLGENRSCDKRRISLEQVIGPNFPKLAVFPVKRGKVLLRKKWISFFFD